MQISSMFKVFSSKLTTKNLFSNLSSKVKNIDNMGDIEVNIVKGPFGQAPTPSEDDLNRILEAWNSIDHVVRIRNIIPMTRRYDELRLVMQMVGLDGVMEAIKKVSNSEWMKNKGNISFDSFMNRNNIQKLLEGSYEKDFKSEKQKPEKKPEKFNNFPQRCYDYEALEKKLMQK